VRTWWRRVLRRGPSPISFTEKGTDPGHFGEIWWGCVVTLILLFGVNANGWVTPQPSKEEVRMATNSFEFRPGVIVDPDRSVVYLMNTQGGIDAVDLASGKLLWRTNRAAKPLLGHEELLVAQTEPPVGQPFLRIALLNTREITADPRFVDITLPADVQATIDDGMESSFNAAARIDEGALVLSWRYTYRRITGPPPGPDDQALDRTATGRVRIDIHTGQIDPIDDMAALPEPELPAAVIRLKDGQAPPGPVWRVGNVLVAIERATYEGKQRVSLKRWDAETGEALADVTLFDGGLNFRSVSADKRHLLASRRDASDSRTWEWAVYSLETGAKVAELRYDTPAAWFFLSGSRLIHETNVTSRLVRDQVVVEPGKLRAVDLTTGTEVWSHAIRETNYRGPYPPRIAR
jgi:hypothetical protein